MGQKSQKCWPIKCVGLQFRVINLRPFLRPNGMKVHRFLLSCMKLIFQQTIGIIGLCGLSWSYMNLWKSAHWCRYLISYIFISPLFSMVSAVRNGLYCTITVPFCIFWFCSNCKTALAMESSVTWTYLSMVVLMLAWPSSFCSTFGCIPLSIALVA